MINHSLSARVFSRYLMRASDKLRRCSSLNTIPLRASDNLRLCSSVNRFPFLAFDRLAKCSSVIGLHFLPLMAFDIFWRCSSVRGFFFSPFWALDMFCFDCSECFIPRQLSARGRILNPLFTVSKRSIHHCSRSISLAVSSISSMISNRKVSAPYFRQAFARCEL